MRNTFLRKLLSMVLIAVILSALIVAIAFRYTGISAYAGIKLRELEPSAKFLSERTADFLQGTMGYREYYITVMQGNGIWGAELYAFTADGELFVNTATDGSRESTAMLDAVKRHLGTVLAGQNVAQSMWNEAGAVSGAPVFAKDGRVIGAVFLVKPIRELSAAISSLWVALLIAIVIGTLIMVLPVYFISRKLIGPLREMNTAALAMANGDFTIRADDSGKDEVAQLAHSLNYLSTALSHTIEDLTFERNRLRTTLDGLGEGVITVNLSGTIVQANPSSAVLLGGKKEDAIETLPAYQALLPRIAEVLSTGMPYVEEQKIREAMVNTTISPLNDRGGQVEGAILLIRDVTENVRLEQTRKDYVANVSHELRTPLASIRSLADALGDGLVKKDEDKQRYYGYIQKESMRLSRLIDDLLELSRLQSGGVALTKQRMDLTELIYDMAERYGATAAERGSAIRLNIPEECPDVYTNPDRIEQILVILLDNAFKHGAEKGDIEIGAAVEEDHVRVSVANAGVIADEDAAHIFERFYKADRAHSGEGTGLGLSIAHEVAALLDERIWVENAEGKVVFCFTLSRYTQENAKQV